MATTKTTAVQTASQGGAVAANDFISYKNKLTTSVLNRIGQLAKGGITVPAGYKADNQIYLAFLKLSSMETRDHRPLLSAVTPQSVANAMLTMCIQGLSLEKNQVAFIQYGNEVQYQVQYQGRIALAKRYGAGDPQAQVIYEGDVFEYEINPRTGKKVIIRHEQKLENIDNNKIVGAWCLIPYANDPDADPKVEVMTMAEIRQSWMQGATKGQSPAHTKFAGEMAKKTVISKACKLFISSSDDTGIYDATDAAEYQEAETVDTRANSTEASFTELPKAPEAETVEAAAEAVDTETGEAAPEPQPAQDPDDLPDDNFFQA